MWDDSSWSKMFGADNLTSSEYPSEQFNDALLYSQNITIFGIVMCMSLWSLLFSYDKSHIINKPPFGIAHLLAIVTSILVEFIFCCVSMASTGEFLLNRLPWEFYLVFFLWPIIAIVLDQFVKSKERESFHQYQKELRLEFDTKLGKYSPK